MIEKLCQYEDTGLTPSEVAKIKRMMDDGRLVRVCYCHECTRATVEDGEEGTHFLTCPVKEDQETDPMDYCSYGQRKEGGNDADR